MPFLEADIAVGQESAPITVLDGETSIIMGIQDGSPVASLTVILTPIGSVEDYILPGTGNEINGAGIVVAGDVVRVRCQAGRDLQSGSTTTTKFFLRTV